MSWLIFDILMMWCHFVKLAHNVWTMVCVKILSCWQHNASMFVGIISGKLSRDFTRLLGSPRGLKGLLHMLNAIVSSTTANLCFMLWFCFSFCYAKGLAKCKFDDIWLVTNIVYLDPLICYFLIFFVSFGILMFCKSFRENNDFYVELQRNGKTSTLWSVGSSTSLPKTLEQIPKEKKNKREEAIL